MTQSIELFDLVVQLVSLAIGTSAVTSGIRWLLSETDAVSGGQGARFLSWGVAFALTAVGLGAGWFVAPEGELGLAWLVRLWPVVAALANLIYDKVLKLAKPESSPATTPPAAPKRRPPAPAI